MGMEDGRIEDEQLSSTSREHSLRDATKARLNNVISAWIPAERDADPYIEVDFHMRVNIAGIATQGYTLYDTTMLQLYTATFQVLFSVDEATWSTITDVNHNEVSTLRPSPS